MTSLVSSIASLLRPSGEELHRLVRREIDPAHASEFEAICYGPAGNALLLIGVVVCAAVVTPFRIISRLRRT